MDSMQDLLSILSEYAGHSRTAKLWVTFLIQPVLKTKLRGCSKASLPYTEFRMCEADQQICWNPKTHEYQLMTDSVCDDNNYEIYKISLDD